MFEYILMAVIITNTVTFAAFGIDKLKAIKGRWRIPEKTLLLMGFCFGGVGQLIGMKIFRHKTHKWYFVFSGALFIIIQFAILLFVYTKWKIL